MEKYIISVIGKDLFPARMRLEKKFGEVLYNQLIVTLSMVAEEIESNEIADYRIGVYLDSKNPGARKFEMGEFTYWNIVENFGHGFYSELGLFAKNEQRKGTDVLFQLNSGNISMKDFEERL